MRTRSAFAATFAAVAAASPGAYTSGLTYASAKPPKMPTIRYRTPAILARRFGVGVIVPESAERANGAPVITVSCTTAIGALPCVRPRAARDRRSRTTPVTCDRTANPCKWQATHPWGKEDDETVALGRYLLMRATTYTNVPAGI